MDGRSPERGVTRTTCPVCGGGSASVGVRRSTMSETEFTLARCVDCRYVFVRDPRTDFATLYDAAYYSGVGADSSVNYDAEMADPRSVRNYEWRGIARIVDALVGCGPFTRWLDYGSGLGGLVRYVAEHVGCSIVGFEEGWAGRCMAARGVPHIAREDLAGQAGTFDVVTAIEMIEHTLDPVAVLREIRDLLKPGGTLLLTTGNAAPHANNLVRWSYTGAPDVHVGFFEPATLATALDHAGLEVLWPGWVDGYSDVLRFKVLKALRVHRTSFGEGLLPWGPITRVVDARHRVSAMPAARRPA